MGNFFTDVITRDSRFRSRTPVGDLELLEPVMRELVRQIVQDAAALGIALMVFESYRSQERQADLFSQHATQLRTVGVHHYGLACDLVKVIGSAPSWKGDFTFLGRLAHDHKLIWGGDWGTPKLPHKSYDAVHVQRCSVARQAELFRGEWYPDESYDPYQDLDVGGEIANLMASAEAQSESSEVRVLAAPSGASSAATRVLLFQKKLVGGADTVDRLNGF